jgi:hypothetical protein
MKYEEFQKTLSSAKPPAGISDYLKSLWYDATGDWENAHNIIQNIDDKTAAWIHAYLHRKEGDTGNADYWYQRAGKKRPVTTLEQEWEDIVNDLIHH